MYFKNWYFNQPNIHNECIRNKGEWQYDSQNKIHEPHSAKPCILIISSNIRTGGSRRILLGLREDQTELQKSIGKHPTS